MLLRFLQKLLELLSGPTRRTTGTKTRTVGAALEVETSEDNLPLLTAIIAVDQVHRDGDLPVITVERGPLKNRHGQFLYRQAGQAMGIVVSRFTDHAGLTTLHEIGHFLDYHGLGAPGQWASETDPALGAWRDAVRNSDAVQRLGEVLKSPDGRVTETLSSGAVVEYTINLAYVRYLLRPEELWARSYAQFIAVKSGDAELRSQLDRRRQRPARRFSYGEHWEEADFLPISTQIEALFRQRGWMD
ncbi:MAG: hypothetical protein JO250_05305 [Armatimonadetes bacterium]|nr:hypothetical protein [Armatimonadota bacterium]